MYQKLNKFEIALNPHGARETMYLNSIDYLGNYNLEWAKKMEKFKFSKPGGECIFKQFKNCLRTKV